MNSHQDKNRKNRDGFQDNPRHRLPTDPQVLAAQETLFDTKWITEKFDAFSSQHAYDFAKILADEGLTRTQVRNFFGELRRIEAKGVAANSEAVAHLRHKLLYTVTRLSDEKLNKDVAKAFGLVLEKGLKAITGEGDLLQARFERFTAYFEAVLAYHRFHGGRES
jgi:CRISPR-associated protein Csm2